MENIIALINLGKYILLGICLIGFLLLVLGYIQKNKKLVAPGIYCIVFAVVLCICGYVIYQTTLKKAQNMIDSTYIKYP